MQVDVNIRKQTAHSALTILGDTEFVKNFRNDSEERCWSPRYLLLPNSRHCTHVHNMQAWILFCFPPGVVCFHHFPPSPASGLLLQYISICHSLCQKHVPFGLKRTDTVVGKSMGSPPAGHFSERLT